MESGTTRSAARTARMCLRGKFRASSTLRRRVSPPTTGRGDQLEAGRRRGVSGRRLEGTPVYAVAQRAGQTGRLRRPHQCLLHLKKHRHVVAELEPRLGPRHLYRRDPLPWAEDVVEVKRALALLRQRASAKMFQFTRPFVDVPEYPPARTRESTPLGVDQPTPSM